MVTRQAALGLQGIVILQVESSYARIFEMSRQSQPQNVAEVDDDSGSDVSQAADVLQ